MHAEVVLWICDESYGPARALRVVCKARDQRTRVAYRLPTLSRFSPTNSIGSTARHLTEQPDTPCAKNPDSSISRKQHKQYLLTIPALLL